MREKYVEEAFSRYRIFGEHSDGIHVDIATSYDLTVCSVTREEANKLILHRDQTIDMLVKLALRFSEIAPHEFDKVWGYK